jgi:hypothetical protein
MRGVHKLLRRFIAGSLIVLAALFPITHTIKPAQAAGLDLARDFIGSLLPDAPNIYHEVYFVLPVDAEQIKPDDWILISFPNYQLVNMDDVIFIGNFNTPSYSVVGNTVRITGVALLPGTGMTIANIKATNPPALTSNEVIIKIAEDNLGTVVRNEAIVIPTDTRSVVNASATIQSPLSSLTISGFTVPNAFVTVTENNSVVGTTVASGTGTFTVNILSASPGAHTYLVFATDAQNRTTNQTAVNVFLIANLLTTVSQLLLSSTMAIDKAEINPGETITFLGAAKPNSQINIFVEGPLRTYQATTDSAGAWSYTLTSADTQAYTPGQYQVYTIVQDSFGNQSITSNTLTFIVKSNDTSNPPPACDISRGDLNCNGVTNLVDFSILLFHWGTNRRVADINADGAVNLTDFSIMMFYFTT